MTIRPTPAGNKRPARLRRLLLLPTADQWSRWSLPAKITLVSCWIGVLSLVLGVVFFVASTAPQRATAPPWQYQPEAFVSLLVLPIGTQDQEASQFVAGVWLLAEEKGENSRVFATAAAFKVLIASHMPIGTPDLVVQSLGLQVVERNALSRRDVSIFGLSTGGADAPLAFVDFTRTSAEYWPFRWWPDGEYYWETEPSAPSVKILKPGEVMPLLVSEAPSQSEELAMSSELSGNEEEFWVVVRADLALGNEQFVALSREAVRLAEIRSRPGDSSEQVTDFAQLVKLQRATMSHVADRRPGSLWALLAQLGGSQGWSLSREEALAVTRRLNKESPRAEERRVLEAMLRRLSAGAN